ncbi:MAG: single-stranded DNA-binding protein [Clostridia bacterium]|nr:single-stranded DNA-binding protein [Clostridia bacterium]
MLNSIVLMGRLTADPELRTTSSNISVTSFTIAVERNFADRASGERQTDFIDIVAWRSTAEFVSRYFRKGQLVAVQGSLQSRKWQDRDGNNRTSWEVQADQVFFAEPKRDSYSGGGNSANRFDSYTPPPARQEEPSAYSSGSDSDFTPLPDDDLPF